MLRRPTGASKAEVADRRKTAERLAVAGAADAKLARAESELRQARVGLARQLYLPVSDNKAPDMVLSGELSPKSVSLLLDDAISLAAANIDHVIIKVFAGFQRCGLSRHMVLLAGRQSALCNLQFADQSSGNVVFANSDGSFDLVVQVGKLRLVGLDFTFEALFSSHNLRNIFTHFRHFIVHITN